MYRAALFDLDGTLTDSMNLSAQAFIHTLRHHLGKEFTAEGIFAMFGPPEEKIFHRLAPDKAEAMLETYLEFYRREHNRLARLFREMVPALELLEQRKIHRAIITGKGDKATAITLEKTGLNRWFNQVVTGSCVKHPKPNPEGIEKVLAGLDVAPLEAFYVGDSPGDMETARRAGVLSVAALWGARDEEALLAQRPDQAFHTPGQFFAWLQQYC